MSTLRSLNKPKKHRNTGLFVLAAAVLVIGIIVGIAALSRGEKYKIPEAVVKTEVVEETTEDD